MAHRSILLLAMAGALFGCAPKPEPVTIEPVYTGKYGAAVGECRPTGRYIDAQYPAGVPDCPLDCDPGQIGAAATSQSPAMCRPDPTRGSDGGNRMPGNPTGGQQRP
eukprot:Anaeramoba_flamelloidesa582985_5.p3 GENE.a582985_5~~a582985_5.p3  ORF type:complete len:107 (+),score=25.69 a582985_5:84-404(+)